VPRAQSRIGPGRKASAALLAVLVVHAAVASLRAQGEPEQSDPVVARLYQHLGDGPRPIILAVGAGDFPPPVWNRVKHLVAFRLHRQQPDGTTLADAATYLIRDSALYAKAAEAARNRSTQYEYVWCLLAAAIPHEAQHPTANGWSPVSYVGKVEAKLRHPREHY